jgi:hypothetical protein
MLVAMLFISCVLLICMCISGEGDEKTIHMIALGKKFIEKLDWPVIFAHLKFLNPKHKIVLYKDEEIQAFMMDHYPQYLQLFYQLPSFAWKSDLARYLILYKYGGIYLDVDLKPFISFDDMLSRSGNPTHVYCIGGRKKPPFEGANGFMVVPKADQLFFELIKYMPGDIQNYRDVTLQVKRFYQVLNESYGGLQDFTLKKRVGEKNDNSAAYFLRETWQGPGW